MPAFPLKTLVGKLNPVCRRALEAAAGLCLSRTNYNVEIEHYLLKLLEVGRIRPAAHPQALRGRSQRGGQRELTRALDKLKTGNARRPGAIDRNPRRAARGLGDDLAQLPGQHDPLRLSAGRDPVPSRKPPGKCSAGCEALAKIPAEQLAKDVPALDQRRAAEDQYESVAGPAAARPTDASGRPVPGDSKTPALDQYTMNLTERANKGEIDPVIGRDFEIRQVIDILTRRRQNNPILTGEAGVGKTAVVEGFALRDRRRRRAAAACATSPCARSTWACLQAGAGVKGEFENRLKSGDRGGQGLAAADHPVHRRGPHDDRRRRRGRAGRRRQPAQAGPGPRRAAHHRGHHLDGVQEILRGRPRPETPFPGRQGRGARRRQGDRA